MGKPKVANEPLHSTAHITFNTSQSKFMAKVYKSEMKMLGIGKGTEKEEAAGKPEAVQRPASTGTRAVLYEGVSKEGSGRAEYLKRQGQRAPQQRFRMPMTASQTIGWDHGTATYNKSPFARKQIVKTSFERERGVLIFESDGAP
jgi:hypothetical protein